MNPHALHLLVGAKLVGVRGRKKDRTRYLSAATYRLLDRLAQRGLADCEGERGPRVSYRWTVR